MRAYYEIGDRFYEADYSRDVFLKIQESLIEMCMEKNAQASLEEGRDKKGYYITLVGKKDTDNKEKPLYSLQYEKKEELECFYEVAINKPVSIEEGIFDCDNLSILRMTMVLKAAENGIELPDYWLDKDNVEHVGDIKGLLEKVLCAYQKRNEKLDRIYGELLHKLYGVSSKEELSELSFDGITSTEVI